MPVQADDLAAVAGAFAGLTTVVAGVPHQLGDDRTGFDDADVEIELRVHLAARLQVRTVVAAWITRDELRTGQVRQTGPLRPSWCYGTPGIARAQQIAAIATGDTSRQTMAEHALAACLSDPSQLHQITDTGLCHGWSGLYQTAWRAARAALTPTISTRLPHLAELVTRHTEAEEHHDTRFLDGAAGLTLALHTATRTTPPISGWDSCLLIN